MNKSPIVELIEQQQVVDEAAWSAFTKEYDLRNPPNTQKRNLLQIGMMIGLIASLALSGLMTIPAFMRVLDAAGIAQPISITGGFAGFIAVDLVMFFSTYYLVNTYYKPKALKGDVDMSQLMQAFSVAAIFGFIVSAGSNIYFVLIGYNVIALDSQAGVTASLMVGLLLAFAPPIQASATGSIMALLPLTDLMEREAYENARNKAWGRYKKKRGLNLDIEAITEAYVEKRLGSMSEPVHLSVPSAPFGTDLGQTQPASYKRDAAMLVREHLIDNPLDMGLSTRRLADKIGVGKSTVSRVKNEMADNGS